MMSRRLVNTTSGISANGIPNERITWLSTSVRVGLSPSAITTNAGTIVARRRTQSGICQPVNPCMMIWPESVPTAELERPEKTSASAKIVAAAAPRIGVSVW